MSVHYYSGATVVRCDVWGCLREHLRPHRTDVWPASAIRESAWLQGWATDRGDVPAAADYCPACVGPAGPIAEPDEPGELEVGHA